MEFVMETHNYIVLQANRGGEYTYTNSNSTRIESIFLQT